MLPPKCFFRVAGKTLISAERSNSWRTIRRCVIGVVAAADGREPAATLVIFALKF
jgi:hypothetical protein